MRTNKKFDAIEFYRFCRFFKFSYQNIFISSGIQHFLDLFPNGKTREFMSVLY